jgi:hypothetical protein
MYFEVDAIDSFDGVFTRSEVARESGGNNGGLSHKVALYKFPTLIYEKTR